ncbi:MAG TPA: cytochrome c [Candidatus Sulfotelmatobacter sp.]|nr:cytochrome c [Candidatus Sulfotelmatobacter sp.]
MRRALAISLLGFATCAAQTPPNPKTQTASGVKKDVTAVRHKYPPDLVQKGAALFRQDCSFCHGRDAGGGESGPDLTRSRLVRQDVNGNEIGPVVLNGRPDKGMPRFDHSEDEIASLVAFIHTRQNEARNKPGGRKGVDASDLQTGNADAGKQYFNGAGGCAACHSPSGDLAGIASRLQGLQLEKQMLYPKHAKSRVKVTPASGETVSGTLEYLDEFTIGIVDSEGVYRSWRTRDVRLEVDASVNAHVELFSKYTDDDVHNLMAYLQTLR